MASIAKLVDSAIKDNAVVVFSKSYCPYCVKAKDLLTMRKVSFVAFELDKRQDGPQIQDYLQHKTGQRTVPNIFINQIHVGGSSDLDVAASSGELNKLLKEQ